ncbi:MAG: site-2 protease family protein, partial [Acidimicrobiales bacterium]
ADEERSYRQATFPRRLLVASAGSIVHFILAFALLFSMFVFVGRSVATTPYVEGLLSFRGHETPAQMAGLRAGDRFVSIDGHHITAMQQISSLIGGSPGKLVHIVVLRDGHRVGLVVKPVDGRGITEFGPDGRRYRSSKPLGIIGVGLSNTATQKLNPIAAVPRSATFLGTLVADTGNGLATVFSLHGLNDFAHQVATAGSHPNSSGPPSHNRRSRPASGGASTGSGQGSSSGSGSSPQLLSFLGAIQIGAAAAGRDVGFLLILLAYINIFVGIVNLVPMLPLDGGHVAIAVYERLRSRRGRRYHADVTKILPVAYVFLAFIVIIGIGAVYANIVQPAHLPGG